MTTDDAAGADRPEPNSHDPERPDVEDCSGVVDGSDVVEPSSEAGADSAAPPSDVRTDKRTTIVIAVLLSLIALAVNLPYQYVTVGSRDTANVESIVDFSLHESALPVMGGWPFRYWISYPEPDGGENSTFRFSAIALLYNVSLAALVVACGVLYIHRRNRRIALGKVAKGKITILDLLALTVLLAAPFGWWQRLEVQHHQESKLRRMVLEGGGMCLMSAWAPGIVAPWIPAALSSNLLHIQSARIEYPESELISQLVDHRELSSLRIGAGDYELRLLDRLAANPHLHDLRISGRVIDGRVIQWIASNKRLESLNLMRTNVSAEALQSLSELPNLQRLNLIHSEVKLSDLGTPKWSKTVRELMLGHPDPGDASTLSIEGWPRLEKLSINELESQANSTAMKVRLADLPALETLSLDLFQKFDLTLRNLPQLSKIEKIEFEWQTRIPRGGTAPGTIWFSRFDAQGLDSLEELEVFGLDFEHFRVRDSPKFTQLGVGAFYHTTSAATYAPELTTEVANSIIEGIGESDGPALLDLDAVPLAGADLSPLANNRRLTELLLSKSGTELKQWKGLEKMQWLTRFEVKNCPIDANGIAWVLDTFPNLEHFAFSSDENQMFTSRQSYSLEIVDRAKLQTLDFGEFPMVYFSKVRVVNSPNIKIPLRLGYVGHLEVVNAPSVTGISVSSPLPRGVKFSGLRDLSFFAVGGPQVTDELIEPLAQCNQLHTLTLAYPKVTAEGLEQLSNLSEIVSLSLPGSEVDDSVIGKWPPLSRLSYLDLSDTRVTEVGLQRLLEGGLVTHLTLNNTKISRSSLADLAKLQGLSTLMLAGTGIDSKVLDSVLDNGSLRRLDLSDSDIAPEIFDSLLAKAGALKHLVLRNCDVDSNKLQLIAARFPQLRFDLNGSTASTKLLTHLVSSQRVVDADGWNEFQAVQVMMSSMQGGSTAQREPPSIINVSYFASLSKRPRRTNIRSIIPPRPVSFGEKLNEWFNGAIFGGPTPPPESSDSKLPDEPISPGSEFEESSTVADKTTEDLEAEKLP